jgi:hypothetical protein
LAYWLEPQGACGPVVAQLTQAIEAHQHTCPADDFAWLHHREQTLLRHVQARFFAPLLGLEPLTAFATHEHPLATLLGRSYQSSTLQQFLGHLERVGADAALLPALLPIHPGQRTSLDGHRIAYWARVPMHQGKITMRGRILAGSQAVSAHNEAGQAVCVASPPPDLQGSGRIVAYCQQVVEATGSALLVIARAVNSQAMAAAVATQDWGVLCRLDDNEQQGRESFQATLEGPLDEGSQVYSGPWKAPRQDDPRHCVIVEPAAGQTVVDWGTPKLQEALEALEWPRVYRERTAIQDKSCKRMIDHGALETTYGRKKIVGPDRHQPRQRAHLEAALETAQQRVDKKGEALEVQRAKVAESQSTGHGKRLGQRQQALGRGEQALKAAQHKHDHLAEHVGA